MQQIMTIKAASQIAGSIGYPSKMPGTSYGISAKACITGSKLAKIEGSTCHGCYALKANYQYPSVAMAHATRLAGISNPAWSMAMVTLLKAAHKPNKKGETLPPFHRWHDSGDLQSVEHLTKICVVAMLTPELKHWLPTRELSIVKAYTANGGKVPSNLTIRVSATMVDGAATNAWPNTSTVHNKTHKRHFSPLNDAMPDSTHYCPAPKQQNKCGACRACWSHAVKNVSYHLH